ncbi:hypothetical protein SNOG_07630 [Parastagonospora nodorum SN15]|uniref:Uncharacterized protein n=1 Tax=Phaeosphaeria nodorum (strain SN15 / ATCC MYA-4574 / FGSC 10173) TaxID=321614 RepID=Q0UKT4_PHANO|nr:hypothetical protein SNOG_07630 [Parastagonospora nodorum SN15]EAT85096.1 hypothetical protein SNOG_07630 [Parastagonospora nodorum SN15]
MEIVWFSVSLSERSSPISLISTAQQQMRSKKRTTPVVPIEKSEIEDPLCKDNWRAIVGGGADVRIRYLENQRAFGLDRHVVDRLSQNSVEVAISRKEPSATLAGNLQTCLNFHDVQAELIDESQRGRRSLMVGQTRRGPPIGPGTR